MYTAAAWTHNVNASEYIWKGMNHMETFDAAYFDRGIERRGTNAVKWDGMYRQHGDKDMIPMWVADMDFPSPPAIQAAVARVAAQGTWGYTLVTEEDAKALCGFWKRRHNVEIETDQVLMSPCVVTGMRISVQALTMPGDGVLINPPVYGPFYQAVRESGRQVIESPMILEEGRYHLNFTDMEEKLASHAASAILFCSPHNPCGRVWTEAEMSELLALSRKYGTPLICDEIHAEFVYAPARHVSILELADPMDAVVMLCAASKTFNVAGLQQSAMVSRNPQIRRRLATCRDRAGVVTGNPFSLAATRAAYTDCDAWLDGLLQYLVENKDIVMEHARSWKQVRVLPLEATYLMWLDCRELGLSQEELLKALLDAHICVNDGRFFGPLGEGFVRLNIGCPRAQLRAALACLDKVFCR